MRLATVPRRMFLRKRWSGRYARADAPGAQLSWEAGRRCERSASKNVLGPTIRMPRCSWSPILITAHEVVRGAFDGALEVAVIRQIVADDVQRDLAWRQDPKVGEFGQKLDEAVERARRREY
jgi:hypothetical protein